jgi:hypothetical protein
VSFIEVDILPNDGSIPLKTATLRKISVIFLQRQSRLAAQRALRFYTDGHEMACHTS